MTQGELIQYAILRNKFEEECIRVCNILANSKMRHGECEDIRYAGSFCLINNSIVWEGEGHSGLFPADFLTMSDDELRKIVEKENEEWEAEQKRKKKEKEELERALRMAEYERLKREFEG